MHELLTPQQMSEADRLTVARGVPGVTLMENAGRAVFETIVTRFARRPVLVLCGAGNNGGDGFVVARLLREAGWPVDVYYPWNRAPTGDALINLRRWDGTLESRNTPTPVPAFERYGLVIDAIYGAGLDRDVDPLTRALVESVAVARPPVLAIDLPSGIDGATGEVRGAAFSACLTVTFFRLKPGHLLFPGRDRCGEVVLSQIGIAAEVLAEIAPEGRRNLPGEWSIPALASDTHKYARGHCLVVSGDALSSGAARLSARAAARAGAGLVTLAGDREAMLVQAGHVTDIMTRVVTDAAGLCDFVRERKVRSIVIGPAGGVGAAMREKVAAILKTGAPIVLDADALTSFADAPDALFDAIGGREAPVVLTPHAGEFERLFGAPGPSKHAAATAAAARSGATVVLKGSDTVIARPDGAYRINANAPGTLATAGSGDVLAGIIGGLLAQGIDGFAAASAAVWIHGATARAFGGQGLVADDLPDELPKVLAGLTSD